MNVYEIGCRLASLSQEIASLAVSGDPNNLLDEKHKEQNHLSHEQSRLFAEMRVCKCCGEHH